MFHAENGVYAQGVGRDTATLPMGWADRLVPVSNENTEYRTGWCLDVHDLCVSKLIANREKDLHFVDALIRWSLVDPKILRARLSDTFLPPERQEIADQYLSFRIDDVTRYVAPELPLVDLDDPNHPRNLIKDPSSRSFYAPETHKPEDRAASS